MRTTSSKIRGPATRRTHSIDLPYDLLPKVRTEAENSPRCRGRRGEEAAPHREIGGPNEQPQEQPSDRARIRSVVRHSDTNPYGDGDGERARMWCHCGASRRQAHAVPQNESDEERGRSSSGPGEARKGPAGLRQKCDHGRPRWKLMRRAWLLFGGPCEPTTVSRTRLVPDPKDEGGAMVPDPSDPDIELVCSGCGYRTTRKASRLRRDTEVICPHCGSVIVPEGHERPNQRRDPP